MNGSIGREDAVSNVTEIDGLSSLIEASVEKELATETGIHSVYMHIPLDHIFINNFIYIHT